MWISPSYQDTDFSWPLSLDDKIKIFEDRTLGWQLDIADKCINGERDPSGHVIAQPIRHSGFAALHIVLSYFEMIAKHQHGFDRDGSSRRYFRKGVFSVFPTLVSSDRVIVDQIVDLLYQGVRCGLYHAAITDPRIVLTGNLNSSMIFETHNLTSASNAPLHLGPKHVRLVLNPHILVPTLKAHFAEYCEKLENPANICLRQNFERRFDFQSA